jgi:primosomal protein N'
MHSKIKNKYRWQVIVKAPDLDEIKEAVREAKMELLKGQLKGISIIVDVDPVNLV